MTAQILRAALRVSLVKEMRLAFSVFRGVNAMRTYVRKNVCSRLMPVCLISVADRWKKRTHVRILGVSFATIKFGFSLSLQSAYTRLLRRCLQIRVATTSKNKEMLWLKK